MLRQRVLAALVLLPPVVVGVLVLPTRWLGLALLAIVLLALWEWLRMLVHANRVRRLLVLLPYAALMLGLWIWADRATLTLLVWAGVLWWLLALLWLARPGYARSATPAHTALKLGAGVFVAAPAWSAALLLHGSGPLGPQWLLLALVLVWAADVCAYFIGRAFGQTRLAPEISPGKTRAGAWGALGGGLLVAGLAAFWFAIPPAGWPALVLLALVTVIFAIAGDLFESLLKRHSQVKDSGSLIPGHGGVLDRLDSVFAALPVFYAGRSVLGL